MQLLIKEEDLEIPPHFLPQMDGSRDLQKAQAANPDACGNEQHVDEVHGGHAENHMDSSF